MLNRFHISSIVRAIIIVLIIGSINTIRGNENSIDGLASEIQPARAKYAASHSLNISFSLTNNSDDTVYVCKWNTPLEGFNSDMFEVKLGQERIIYLGRLVKRGQPTPDDYIKIAPNGKVTEVIDLSKAYETSDTGEYSVVFASALYDFGKAGPAKLAEKQVFSPKDIRSNPIKFSLIEKREYEPRILPNPKSDTASMKASFSNCTQSQQDRLNSALDKSNDMIALIQLLYQIVPGQSRDTCRRYTTWFGTYTAARWNKVMSNYDAIKEAVRYEDIVFDCGCNENYYAYVYPTQPYKIYVCNLFWSAPLTGTDSKAGTIIHETSHFNVVAGTDDNAYGQAGCKNLAVSNPSAAIDNADSYEYFAENTPVISCYTVKPSGPSQIILWVLLIPAVIALELMRRRYIADRS